MNMERKSYVLYVFSYPFFICEMIITGFFIVIRSHNFLLDFDKLFFNLFFK